MKNQRKYAISMVALILCSFLCNFNIAFARNKSDVFSAPSVKSGQTSKKTDTIEIKSQNYSSVRGNRTYWYIDEFHNLASGWVSSNSRTATIRMYEDDEDPNADDLVKTYYWRFYGTKLMGIVDKVVTNDSGNIDSAGDNQAELYITLSVSAKSGDPSTATSKLFECHFELD